MTYIQLANQLNETTDSDSFLYEGRYVKQNPILVGKLITAVGEEMIKLSGRTELSIYPASKSFKELVSCLTDESYDHEEGEYSIEYTFECSDRLAVVIERLLCMNEELNKEYATEQ